MSNPLVNLGWWLVYHPFCNPLRIRREKKELGYHVCDKAEFEKDRQWFAEKDRELERLRKLSRRTNR